MVKVGLMSESHALCGSPANDTHFPAGLTPGGMQSEATAVTLPPEGRAGLRMAPAEVGKPRNEAKNRA